MGKKKVFFSQSDKGCKGRFRTCRQKWKSYPSWNAAIVGEKMCLIHFYFVRLAPALYLRPSVTLWAGYYFLCLFFCSHLRSLPRRGGEELKKKNIPAMESNIILKMDAFIALINNETWIRCNRYSGLFICRSVCASLSVYFLSTQVEIPPRTSIIRFFGR